MDLQATEKEGREVDSRGKSEPTGKDECGSPSKTEGWEERGCQRGGCRGAGPGGFGGAAARQGASEN